MKEEQKTAIGLADEYLRTHESEMLALWRRLVETESGTMDKEGCDAIGRLLEKELRDSGAETEIVPMETKGNFLRAVWGETTAKAPILFCGHMDTVFPKGTLEKNPFRIENGIAHGPGCLDMKAGLVIAVFVLRALRAAGYHDRAIRVAFPADEEGGHRYSTAKEEILRSAAGCAAAFNFETGYPDDGLVVGRKGSFRAVFEVSGVAAHSGNAPEKGRSAILQAAHQVIELQKLNDLEHGTSVNVGVIRGGTTVNAVPDFCTLDIDVRFTKEENLRKTQDAMQRIADTVFVPGTSTKLISKGVNQVMEPNDAIMGLFEHIRRTAEETGYGAVKPIRVGGWSDACLIASLGVPVVCAMGVKGENNHSPMEYAIVDSLLSRARLAAAAVITLE